MESGINRSQLALFEVGKYNLEAYKRLALVDCYLRQGYRFDTDISFEPALIQSIRKNEIVQPSSTQKSKGASAHNLAQFPRIIDGIIISSELAKSDINRISEEINRNDIIIKRLGNTTVDLSLFREPLTNEHETIIRLMRAIIN